MKKKLLLERRSSSVDGLNVNGRRLDKHRMLLVIY